jgi:hypothetical protein
MIYHLKEFKTNSNQNKALKFFRILGSKENSNFKQKTYKGLRIRLASDFSTATLEVKTVKQTFKNEGEMVVRG